jgi:hypothetical protein
MSNPELDCKIACHEVMLTFAAALDRWANSEAADLFAEEGAIAQPDGDRVGPQVRAFLMKRSPEIITHHIVTNVIVRPLESDTAEGTAYVMAYRAPAEPDTLPRPLSPLPHGVGEWIMRFRKTAGGWRITRFAAVSKLAPTAS